MNILITGGLGFIGSNLAKKCIDSGHNVHILSRSKNKIKNIKGIEDRVKLTIKDIKDIEEEVKDQDWIFHFASTVDNYNIWDNPYKDIDINCTGTISLLEACRKINPSAKILYSSTFFVNGNLEKLPASKNSPTSPQGLYPATRLAGEQFCKIYNNVFGMNSIIARFTNVFGEKEQKDNKKKAAFNKLINMAVNNEEIPLYSEGNFVRDYIYVSDVVEGCIKIMEKGKIGETYYVGRGEGINFKELMEMVIEEAKGGKLVSIHPPDFHKNVGIQNYYCDNSDLRKLGWKPKVSLREGIKRTIESYKNE